MQTLNRDSRVGFFRIAERDAGQRLDASSLTWWQGDWWRFTPPAVPRASAWGRDS